MDIIKVKTNTGKNFPMRSDIAMSFLLIARGARPATYLNYIFESFLISIRIDYKFEKQIDIRVKLIFLMNNRLLK